MRNESADLPMTELPQLDPAATNTWGSHRRRIFLESTFVFLLVAAAFVLRVWALSKAHFWDETVYLQNAEVICCGKANYSELGSRPPLLSLIFAGVFLLWNNVYAASIVTALLNALGSAFLYVSGRLISGRIPAIIASLLLAFSPFFVGVFPAGFVSDDTGNSLLSDSPALTLILLAFWLLLRALRKQTGLGFTSAGFVLALAVLMRFASLSSAGVLALLVFAADRWWSAALSCCAGFASGIGPYLCWSRFRYGGFFTTFRRGWGNFEGPGESPLFYLKNFGNIFSWITLAGLALWIGRWAWEHWKQKRGDIQVEDLQVEDLQIEDPRVGMAEHAAGTRSRRLEAFLWLWAAILLLFFSALHHKEPRYAMPLAPPLFLLAGSGLSVLLGGRQTGARVSGTVLLVAALGYTFLSVLQRFDAPLVEDEVTEEMQVSDFLSGNVPPATVLYSNFNYPVFAYYTNLPVHSLPESGPALYNLLDRLPSDGILIAYKESKENDIIADPRLGWLDANPHYHRFQEFPSLVLYEYRVTARK
jgi:4-amino-4-deoxy-L-arabinose transferase-like glycosyltransferase